VILPGVFHVCSGCQQWDSPVVLVLAFPASTFCVRPHPLTRQGEGRGSRWGGLPIFTGVVLVGVLVDLAFKVVFMVFDVCWLSMDRWWVLMVLGGVSRPFSECSWSWEVLTDLGDVVAALLAG